ALRAQQLGPACDHRRSAEDEHANHLRPLLCHVTSAVAGRACVARRPRATTATGRQATENVFYCRVLATLRGTAALLVVTLALGCGDGSRGVCEPTPPLGRLGTICGFTNPEDIEAVPAAGLLIVSEMRGRDGAGAPLAALVPPLTAPPPLGPTGDAAHDVGTAPPAGDPA